MNTSTRALWLAIAASLSGTGYISAQAQPAAPTDVDAAALLNSGFEGVAVPVPIAPADQKAKITGSVADGWADNSSWADVDINYAIEAENAHSGQTAQKIEVMRIGSGGPQFVQNVKFAKNHIYRFTVWLKGAPGQSVQLVLRKDGAPYTDYASKTASLNAEWHAFQVWGQVPEDSAGYVMLRASAPMTFWVDDGQLEDVTNAKANAAPKKGNLMPGGNFEAGVGFGWSGTSTGNDPNVALSHPRPQSDTTTAAVGNKSLRLDLTPFTTAQISTPVMQTNFGQQHTLSMWVKSSFPDTPVNLELAYNSELKKSVMAGTTWQRVTWTFPMPLLTTTRFLFSVSRPQQKGALWIDGVQLEEKPAPSPNFVPDAPYEVALQMPRWGNIVFDGEAAKAALAIAPAPPQGAQLRLSYQDLDGKSTELRSVSAHTKSLALPVLDGRRGIWKLRAHLVDIRGVALSSPVELVWARLPRPRAVDANNSSFGIHVPIDSQYLGLARDTGNKWNRLHDLANLAKWPVAETSKGHFEFYDHVLNLSQKYGIATLGMLDGAPEWVTTKSRGDRYSYWGLWNIPDAPGALDEWRNYVRTVTSHYKGRIDNWEVWNEPWGNWWISSGNPNATPQLYAQLLKIADEETKKANPSATIVGIDTFPGHDDKWTLPVLRALPKNSFDAFSFHDYNDSLYSSVQPRAEKMVGRFDELQKQFGTPKPQWMTEGGPVDIGSFYAPETGGIAPFLQPTYMVRYDVSHLAAGTRKVFLYSVRPNTPMGQTGYQATEHDGAIRPLLAARAVLAFLVDGAGRPTYRQTVKGVDCYDFPAQKGRRVSVLWASDSTSHPVPVPHGMRALDLWGNDLKTQTVTVGLNPVYFVQG